MFQNVKKAALLLSCTLSIGMCAACGKSFDASAYTKAMLDNTYKNDSAAFVEMGIGTKEEAADSYNDGINTYIGQALSSMNLSDEQMEAYHTLFADIFSKVKYTVGEASRRDDGSFDVDVRCEKMDIFGPAVEAYIEEVTAYSQEMTDSGETLSEEEVYAKIAEILRDCLNDSLADVTYEPEETVTVHVAFENKTYSLDAEAANILEAAFFDLEAFNDLLAQ